MTDVIIDGVYEGDLTTMAEHVLLVAARDIHHCGGLGGLIALVAIRVCGYQLLRRNKQGDFESNCSGVIGGTDEQLFAPPIYLAHRSTDRDANGLLYADTRCTKTAALRMVFKTVWEAQANLPQEFRAVTSVQLLKAANEKYNFATPIRTSNLDGALKGKKATFKRNPDSFGSYIPN
jgi:hypothetical protein